MINMRLGDCMELMREAPDKSWDLAIVDPPYGIGEDGSKNKTRGKAAVSKDYKGFSGGDVSIPDEEYFLELRRVSIHQIVWGGNYMTQFLPPSMGWVFWDKHMEAQDFSDGELAWTSFDKALAKFDFRWNGMLQGDMKNKESRIHPTQKPVALYKWILTKYAKPGDKILDTHGGSGSIAIACHDLGFDLTWIEKDEDYYKTACERYKKHASQAFLFEPEQVRLPEQGSLL